MLTARDLEIKNVKMIPDGCGTFTSNMGMLVAKPKQGFGMRSWRYAVIVNDGKIEATCLRNQVSTTFQMMMTHMRYQHQKM